MKEKEIAGYPKAISLKGTEEIIKQMKTKICKIFKDNGQKGTGFFCKVPYPNENNLLPVLKTNNHIINELEMNKTIALSITPSSPYFGVPKVIYSTVTSSSFSPFSNSKDFKVKYSFLLSKYSSS